MIEDGAFCSDCWCFQGQLMECRLILLHAGARRPHFLQRGCRFKFKGAFPTAPRMRCDCRRLAAVPPEFPSQSYSQVILPVFSGFFFWSHLRCVQSLCLRNLPLVAAAWIFLTITMVTAALCLKPKSNKRGKKISKLGVKRRDKCFRFKCPKITQNKWTINLGMLDCCIKTSGILSSCLLFFGVAI